MTGPAATSPTAGNDPLVTVVIVNYNGGDFLRQCLAALEAQTFRDFETILVDNDSHDDSITRLADGLDGVRLIRAGANLGFAAANNLAAGHARGRWIATLNPDAFADPTWLKELVEATERHGRAVMFGSTQIDFTHRDRLDGTGDVFHAIGLMWRGHHGRPIDGRLPPEGLVFSPCAAAALYRRDVFLEAGGFDERFFCYCEDVDLGFRLHLLGHIGIQVPTARVLHVGSGIVGRKSPFAVYHGTRNLTWTFVKNMPPSLFWPMLPFHLAIQVARLLGALRWGVFRAALTGLVHSVLGIAPIIATRRSVQRSRRASVREIARALCWSPITLLTRGSHVRPLAPLAGRPQVGSNQRSI